MPPAMCVRRILAQRVQRLGEWMSFTPTPAVLTDQAITRTFLDSIGRGIGHTLLGIP